MKQLSALEKAIVYIEAHLNENIGLEDVSRETGYSYYHMTRLFSSILGESVGRYINRRRLYNAAEKLIHSDRRVIDIALECGFASPEAFSRAFKNAFGKSPADYRKAGLDLVANAKKRLDPKDVYHIANNISHSPDIVMTQDTKVAGIRGTTSLYDNTIPELWARFCDLRPELFASRRIGYSICETHQTTYAKDGDVSFSILVGAPVTDYDTLPGTLATKTLKGGKYAVFIHRGSFANLVKTYQYIYGTWLPSAKEELDDRVDFEVYERQVVSFDDPDNEVKIYIPIK